ncbi:pseudouridine-5'-phosphate glycosidase [Pontibacillus salicampi]|uniref:Pseudouridine-5'-phosphate glycosidase n=1 Tax=Pontibacillus salicampi TaxID=1449801 RepID=A0ABV6LI57_9BACI
MNTLQVSTEIREAIIDQRPIVALESSFLSHGIPYPENVEVALEAAENIRRNGAVPATIALIDGQIKVGITKQEIQMIASKVDVRKTSIQDLPHVLSLRHTGTTTIATAAYAARHAGIRFLSAAGLGGVHTDIGNHLDISNDLFTMAESNICVVTSGIHPILDTLKTLDLLEALGVPVYGYETEHYPGFFNPATSIRVDSITANHAAEIMQMKDHLTLNQSIHIAAPLPAGKTLPEEHTTPFIHHTLQQMKDHHVSGKEVTNHWLSSFRSDKDILNAYKCILLHNADITAKIASLYHQSTP